MRRSCKPLLLLLLVIVLALFAACSGGNTNLPNSDHTTPAAQQVLRFPNVGTSDIERLDPASGPDSNSNLAISMIYSGLVRSDHDLNVLPDQATWEISSDHKTYTFHLKAGLMFSDGTPLTAQSYVYTWTRALLPEVKSPLAPVLEEAIVGAQAVLSGKTRTLAGVRALDKQTLQVSLVRPTAYFLQVLTVSLFFPLNQNVIERYGQDNWSQHAAGNGIGSGPFLVQSWHPLVSMTLVPNPHYYGKKTRLHAVEMLFVKEPSTAFQSYRAGQYDFVWDLPPQDQQEAKTLPGFIRTPILQSDLLFFDNTTAPFNQVQVRQAFAAAIDKKTLASAILKDTVTPASTIIPPGEPGSQPDYLGIPFDRSAAKHFLQAVYPDVTKMPPVTFTYPASQVTADEAAALQQMWQEALSVQVQLHAMDLSTYNDATTKRTVQLGFTQWSVYFPDPYEWLDLSLLSTAANNNGSWKNAQFDRTVAQAEQSQGDARLALYAQAERIAIENVGWLPLDHQSLAALIPPRVHGLTLNGEGLYFGDWSDISLS